MSTDNHTYKFLARREGSAYPEYFVKGRSLLASTLYAATLSPEDNTPEEVAADYGVPVEAVYEAIDCCTRSFAVNRDYQYLGRRDGSSYRQYFVKGRRLLATTLFSEARGPDSATPEEVAEDYDVPVEAVYEAIDYCARNFDLLVKESEEAKAWERARGYDKPPFVPSDYNPES